MSDRNERGKDVTDRLSKRFQEDEPDENDESSEPVESSERSENEVKVQPAEPVQQDGHDENDGSDESDEPDKQVESGKDDSGELNVKEEWNGRYMYIPPEIDNVFDSEFDRLVYECGRDLDWKPKKNKHYYPVAVSCGVEAVKEMDPEEFLDVVDKLELPRED